MKRLTLLIVCLALPQPTFAASIIWEAFGLTSVGEQYGSVAPPP